MRHRVPLAMLAALALALFWPWLASGRTLWAVGALRDASAPGRPRLADNLLILRTDLAIYNEGLKQGELRLWNPYVLAGVPTTGDPMLHPFYPPVMALHALLPTDAAFEATLMLHFGGAGAAMYAALLTIGRGRAAALLGAFVWMLWGYQAVWFSHATLLGVSVWGPPALAWFARALERGGRRDALLAGGALGLALLGSHPQYALLVGLAMAALWACRPTRWSQALLAAAAAAGVGAAALMAWADVLATGLRDPAAATDRLYGAFGGPIEFLASLAAGLLFFPRDPVVGFEFFAHVGAAALLLAAAGAWRGRGEAQVRFLAVGGAAAFAIAAVEPLARAAAALPLLNLSPPSRWIFMGGLCLAALAARGIDALPARRPRAAAILLALAELVPVFFDFNRHDDPSLLKPRTVRPEAPAPPRAAGVPRPSRTDAISSEDLTRGAAELAAAGIETLSGFQAFVPARYALWAARAGGEIVPGGRGAHFVRFGSPLLDAAALTHLYWPYEGAPPPRFEPAGPGLWRNTEALPRARVVATVRPAPDPESASALLLFGEPARSVVLEGAPAASGDPPAASVVWKERTPVRLGLEVESPAPGVLVIADGYHPAWEARVDGVPAPVLPADVAFRGIPVGPGRHEVTMEFRPASARAGLAVTALFLAAWLIVLTRKR